MHLFCPAKMRAVCSVTSGGIGSRGPDFLQEFAEVCSGFVHDFWTTFSLNNDGLNEDSKRLSVHTNTSKERGHDQVSNQGASAAWWASACGPAAGVQFIWMSTHFSSDVHRQISSVDSSRCSLARPRKCRLNHPKSSSCSGAFRGLACPPQAQRTRTPYRPCAQSESSPVCCESGVFVHQQAVPRTTSEHRLRARSGSGAVTCCGGRISAPRGKLKAEILAVRSGLLETSSAGQQRLLPDPAAHRGAEFHNLRKQGKFGVMNTGFCGGNGQSVPDCSSMRTSLGALLVPGAPPSVMIRLKHRILALNTLHVHARPGHSRFTSLSPHRERPDGLGIDLANQFRRTVKFSIPGGRNPHGESPSSGTRPPDGAP